MYCSFRWIDGNRLSLSLTVPVSRRQRGCSPYHRSRSQNDLRNNHTTLTPIDLDVQRKGYPRRRCYARSKRSFVKRHIYCMTCQPLLICSSLPIRTPSPLPSLPTRACPHSILRQYCWRKLEFVVVKLWHWLTKSGNCSTPTVSRNSCVAKVALGVEGFEGFVGGRRRWQGRHRCV